MSRDKLFNAVMGHQPLPRSEHEPLSGAVEGQVVAVTAAGMTFTVKSWDGGKYIFGPAPWPMSRVEPSAITATDLGVAVNNTQDASHAAHGHGNHEHGTHDHTTPVGAAHVPTTAVPTTQLDHAPHNHTAGLTTGANPGIHDHNETVPVKGDRCLAMFTDNGPWVIGWWPR